MYSYPDIKTMRGTLPDCGINCDDSPLAFVQGAYKVVMTIRHPKTSPDFKAYLEGVLEYFIFADGKRQDEVDRAKLYQHEPDQYENKAFDDWYSEASEKYERDND